MTKPGGMFDFHTRDEEEGLLSFSSFFLEARDAAKHPTVFRTGAHKKEVLTSNYC